MSLCFQASIEDIDSLQATLSAVEGLSLLPELTGSSVAELLLNELPTNDSSYSPLSDQSSTPPHQHQTCLDMSGHDDGQHQTCLDMSGHDDGPSLLPVMTPDDVLMSADLSPVLAGTTDQFCTYSNFYSEYFD